MNNADDTFLAGFENCTLPFEQWNHSAHVRVAFLYASQYEFETACERMRYGVKAYNTANHGVWDAIAARKLGIGFVGVQADWSSQSFAENAIPIVKEFVEPTRFIRVLDSVTIS